MAGNNVRIEQENLRTTRIFIDSNEIKGIQNVNYSMGVGSIPIIRLEFIPETLNFDSEKLADEVMKQINEKQKRDKYGIEI